MPSISRSNVQSKFESQINFDQSGNIESLIHKSSYDGSPELTINFTTPTQENPSPIKSINIGDKSYGFSYDTATGIGSTAEIQLGARVLQVKYDPTDQSKPPIQIIESKDNRKLWSDPTLIQETAYETDGSVGFSKTENNDGGYTETVYQQEKPLSAIVRNKNGKVKFNVVEATYSTATPTYNQNGSLKTLTYTSLANKIPVIIDYQPTQKPNEIPQIKSVRIGQQNLQLTATYNGDAVTWSTANFSYGNHTARIEYTPTDTMWPTKIIEIENGGQIDSWYTPQGEKITPFDLSLTGNILQHGIAKGATKYALNNAINSGILDQSNQSPGIAQDLIQDPTLQRIAKSKGNEFVQKKLRAAKEQLTKPQQEFDPSADLLWEPATKESAIDLGNELLRTGIKKGTEAFVDSISPKKLEQPISEETTATATATTEDGPQGADDHSIVLSNFSP